MPLNVEELTLVIPKTAMFSLNEVVPLPEPKAPASKQPSPLTPMPRLMACVRGWGVGG